MSACTPTGSHPRGGPRRSGRAQPRACGRCRETARPRPPSTLAPSSPPQMPANACASSPFATSLHSRWCLTPSQLSYRNAKRLAEAMQSFYNLRARARICTPYLGLPFTCMMGGDLLAAVYVHRPCLRHVQMLAPFYASSYGAEFSSQG